MPPKKISNKKELPNNAKILHPDGKWRDKKGRLTKKPLDEPTFKYDGRYYTKFKPRTVESKKKPKKPAKPAKPAKKPAKKPPRKQQPEQVVETVRQRLFRPLNLQQLLGARNLRYSRDIAAAIQEATARDVENRMNNAQKALQGYGIDSDIKLAVSPDLTINAEFAVPLAPGVAIRDIFELLKEHLSFPPTVYASVGFRFVELGDKIRVSFPILSARTGELVASKKSKMDAYQAQSGYMETDRALKNIWKFGESFLFKIYSKDNQHNKPQEIFIRMHWNPFVDDEGNPFRPTRQE